MLCRCCVCCVRVGGLGSARSVAFVCVRFIPRWWVRLFAGATVGVRVRVFVPSCGVYLFVCVGFVVLVCVCVCVCVWLGVFAVACFLAGLFFLRGCLAVGLFVCGPCGPTLSHWLVSLRSRSSSSAARALPT